MDDTCTPRRLYLTAAATIASGGGEAPLPRFRVVAYTGVPMRVADWRHPVIIDLAGLSIPSQSRPIRFNHDPSSGVGHTDSISIEGSQLVATGVISRDTVAAREVVTSARNGFPWQASIGATVDEYEVVQDDQQADVNGRIYSGPLDVIRRATLEEISLVDLGADGHTSATIAARKEGGTMQDIQGQAQDTAQDGHTSATIAARKEEDAMQDMQGQAQDTVLPEQEVARVLAIRQVCGDAHTEIAADAIEQGWDVRKTALAVLRASRPQAPAVYRTTSDERTDLLALEAGLRLGARQQVERDYPPQVLDRAERYRRFSLRDVAATVCRWASIELPTHASEREWVRAAFSTRDLPALLQNVAQKTLITGYQAVDRASMRVAKILTAQDFKSHTAVRLSGAFKLEKVAPDGELKHATLTDDGYTFRVETYGKLIGLTRQDVLNDDLGAFTELPSQIGRGAALALESAFWTMVEGAGSFFGGGNGNLVTSNAFGVAGLNKAIAALRKQKDEHGQPILARPRFVALPPDLEADASQIYTSNVLLVAGATDRTVAANNPHANKYEPVVSEHLAGTGANSAWYLLADPADVPAFGVAFLRGQDMPTIEEADPDPKYLGMLWRGYLDFGVVLLDPRGVVKSTA